MGLLSVGTPLEWKDAQKYSDHVRKHGIEQFLNIWKVARGKEKDALLWGDEVEYMVISYDHESRNARLSLRQNEILEELANDEKLQKAGGAVPGLQHTVCTEENIPTFHPEYGRYMLEATPGKPYGHDLADFLEVEKNMKRRRVIAQAHMKDTEIPITLTSFPRLGCQDFTDPHFDPPGPAARSFFLPDEIINTHPRFRTLTANIRSRRGRKVAINVPIFHDKNTPVPFNDPTIPFSRQIYPEDIDARIAAKPDHIYMDAMGFGMGCCCLQITFQAKNITEGRRLYDHLTPLGPVMLALTAAAPVFRGWLADWDCRWSVIAASVDDRTPEELGEVPAAYRLSKSRYDSVDCYISQDATLKPEYNDVPLVMDPAIKQRLLDEGSPLKNLVEVSGVDELLANHIAHLFIRAPLVIFQEKIDQNDLVDSDHFENLQSTNWQHMRFKPPPPGSNIGWRVEFRSMEIQITDFENAAFAVFIVLVTRVILSFGLDFYIPISKVEAGMTRAHTRDAVLTEKFWFRKNVFPPRREKSMPSSPRGSRSGSPSSVAEYEEMTINEIINGQTGPGGFPGLVRLVEKYLDSMNVDITTRCEIGKYLSLVSQRASGKLWTTAKWIRHFIRTHPEYKHDSAVSMHVNYDLVRAVEKITKGLEREEGLGVELLGQYGVDVNREATPKTWEGDESEQSKDKRNSRITSLTPEKENFTE